MARPSLCHTAGKVTITQRDVVWTFDAVNIGDLTAETTKGFKETDASHHHSL